MLTFVLAPDFESFVIRNFVLANSSVIRRIAERNIVYNKYLVG